MTKKQKIISVAITTVLNIIMIILTIATHPVYPIEMFVIIGIIVVLSELASFSVAESAILPFIITFTLVLVMWCSNANEQIYNHAVELYNDGQYEEALDEFYTIKGCKEVDKYIETETVIRLKGTDLEIVEEN